MSHYEMPDLQDLLPSAGFIQIASRFITYYRSQVVFVIYLRWIKSAKESNLAGSLEDQRCSPYISFNGIFSFKDWLK